MNVLGLFDGISTGMLALQRCGIHVERYRSSEVDENAIKVSNINHKDSGIIHLGDVKNLRDRKRMGGAVDLLLGGPPCQSFSIAGNGAGFADSRGSLVLEYVRILNLVHPRYFLMENVPMCKKDMDKITSLLGVRPITLDSAKLSAQRRIRHYWTNIPGHDKSRLAIEKIVLADIMTDGGGHWLKKELQWKRQEMPIRLGIVNKGGQGDRIYSPMGKGITLSAYSGGTAGSGNMLVGDQEKWRKLDIVECERLQTIPDGYTSGVSLSQRHKLIGNAWTVDVIAYLLSPLSQ